LNWNIDQLVADAEDLVDSGYHGIKMKVGTGCVHEDVPAHKRFEKPLGPTLI